MFEMQTPLTQSPASQQVLPLPQSAQLPPPQSTSVSAALRTTSLQSGAAHLPAVQTLFKQSAGPVQAWLVPHLPHVPPQSTSISLPFLTSSKQLGA
jgi:hypothetical protein